MGAHEYLRTQALARIYLDNFENVQSSWVTQGQEIGQIALKFGANDLGSIMIEENVVSQAGATFRMTVADMRRLIANSATSRASATTGIASSPRDNRAPHLLPFRRAPNLLESGPWLQRG